MAWKNLDSKESWQRLLRRYVRPKHLRGRGGFSVPEPVEPNSPKTLSGGAAAPLEFDD